MHKDVKEILYTQQQIAEKCQELATMINHDYHDKEVILVGLLKGSVPFLAELSKYIEIDVTFDYMKVLNLVRLQSKKIWIRMSKEKIFYLLKIF